MELNEIGFVLQDEDIDPQFQAAMDKYAQKILKFVYQNGGVITLTDLIAAFPEKDTDTEGKVARLAATETALVGLEGHGYIETQPMGQTRMFLITTTDKAEAYLAWLAQQVPHILDSRGNVYVVPKARVQDEETGYERLSPFKAPTQEKLDAQLRKQWL